uniref:Uncharacterized protein n=1 Tax=Anser brachyrhynchus TaxID=132585 RepID=A0A8B9BKD1_9AVES
SICAVLVCAGPTGERLVLGTYPPLRVGVKPNSVHSPTDMSRELSTVTTAASARPHFDFTMSIFPEKQNAKSLLRRTPPPLPGIPRILWTSTLVVNELSKKGSVCSKPQRAYVMDAQKITIKTNLLYG